MINVNAKTLSLKNLGNFWVQKSWHHCLFRNKIKSVLASKSHRGKYENTWNQVDNNFGWKKILNFFWDFEVRNFEIMSFYMPKNGFVSRYAWWKRCFGAWKSQRTTRKHVKTIWQQFWAKKKFDFFDDFWAQKFRRNVILYPPEMDFLQL